MSLEPRRCDGTITGVTGRRFACAGMSPGGSGGGLSSIRVSVRLEGSCDLCEAKEAGVLSDLHSRCAARRARGLSRDVDHRRNRGSFTHSDCDRSYSGSERLRSYPQDRMVANGVRESEKSERDERPRIEAESPPSPLPPEVVVWVADQHRRVIAASQSRARFNANEHRLRQ
jgi:hypothetical protein